MNRSYSLKYLKPETLLSGLPFLYLTLHAKIELTDKYTCMSFSQTVSVVSAVFLLASCNNTEIGESKDVNPEAVYLDYNIAGEEGDEDVTCKFQFRMGGPEGTTLVLNNPAKIELDGEPLMVDSSKLGGAYYEIQKPLASFAGKHIITYTDFNKKEFTEEFYPRKTCRQYPRGNQPRRF
jgi:predicted small secreted protein